MKKKIALSLVLAAVFLALAASRVDGEKFKSAIEGMNAVWLLPMVVVSVLTQLVRTVRWWLIVQPVKPIALRRIVPSAFAGFLAINVFPLRAGEVVRPLLLKGRDGIPFTSGLATVVAERVVDALAVFVMLLLSLALVPARTITVSGHTVELQTAARLLLVIFVPAGLFLVGLVVLRGRLVTVVESVLRRVSPRLATLAGHILGSFVQGLEFFRDVRLAAQVVGLTVVIWGLQISYFAFGFLAFELDAPLYAALPALAITMAGITIPGGIGMSGNFQLFCVAALALFAVDESPAFAYAVVINVVGFGVAVVMGLPVLPFLSVKLRELATKGEDALPTAGPTGPS